MSNPISRAELIKMDAPGLVVATIRDASVFKLAASQLDSRPPSPEAAQVLVDAYRQNEVVPWLAACLLGCCRASAGYETVREILRRAPGRCAETYAGPALVYIAGDAAFDDLVEILFNAPAYASREGAAYGLGKIGSSAAMRAVLEATLAEKIRGTTGGWILGRSSPEESVVLALLTESSEYRVRFGTEVLRVCLIEARARSKPCPLETSPSPKILEAVRRLLANESFYMGSDKRDDLTSWLEARSALGGGD